MMILLLVSSLITIYCSLCTALLMIFMLAAAAAFYGIYCVAKCNYPMTSNRVRLPAELKHII